MQSLRAVPFVFLLAACSADPAPIDATTDARNDATGGDAFDIAADRTVADAPPACSAATCTGAGMSCRSAGCVADCRPSDAQACATGTVCDFADGQCHDAASACLAGTPTFEPCASSANPTRACGPGLQCDGEGSCLATEGCSGIDCDAAGHCWATTCSCTRPDPPCSPATLEDLNRSEFVGSLGNNHNGEGAFALGFDDQCAAYVVTMISGPDFLRQITSDGVITSFASTTNLNMGEVAVLRLPGGEFGTSLGEVAATYICCATCGCVESGMDGRLGVVRLDRTSTTRPLPNVLAAQATSGAGPFGNTTIDTGPYGLTWGADHALYVGNIRANGDFSRIDLTTGMSTSLMTFAARVVASTLFDAQWILVGLENGAVYQFNVRTHLARMWAMLPNGPTSLARDQFTGRVYAEVRGTTPQILELEADGSGMHMVHMPPRIGRIAIAPDGYLYHLSVFPAVNWMTHDSIIRWPLPMMR